MLFGQPGAGKTFIGEILQKNFGFFHYDGDLAIPKKLIHALKRHEVVSDAIRDDFFSKLITHVKTYKKKNQNLAVSQTFIKEKYREQFLRAFPETFFILITANTVIREKRLQKENNFELSLFYWRKMATIFESPKIEHHIIVNNAKGEKEVSQQLRKILTRRKDNQ